ncbi:MAG TPA: hypothetical protein VFI24_04380 [Pyrinomonadaceae bacterium]|nr:hypothetical protein [Pyrinomonadaceae bacterium]
MADQLLELAVVTFTTDELTIRVRNISGGSLDKRLVLELFPPAYLVHDKINEAAVAAASSEKPPGAKSLAGVVSGPERWSVWVRREPSDSSLVIVFINDMDQNAVDLPTPVKLPDGAEFTIRIPLDPGANRDHIDFLYGYQHGKDERDPSFNGKLELKPEKSEWAPDVTLSTTHDSPTMVNPGDLVQVCWKIKDGVSATLRGPLPGGNSELTLSPNPSADFKISEGSVEVRVMGGMTYLLQAEVKRSGHPNVQVVRMLWLDTPNHKYSYVYINPEKVLPHGLLEINWAAWGVKEIELDVRNNTGTHTTRTIRLTQQTKGRFFEGSGVMRVTATKTASETVDLIAPPIRKESTSVSVVSWKQMMKPDLTGKPLGMAVMTPKLGVLTTEGLFISEIGEFDPESTLEKLLFSKASKETPRQWLSLAAIEKRFVVLRRTNRDDLEIAPYKVNGSVDEIPPLNLPEYLNPLVAREGTTFDFVGFGGRVYVVVESASPGTLRHAFSVGFNSATKKAEYRSEPLLEQMQGYRLVTFDDALYALNRTSGRMFRFELTRAGALEEPRPAASAITEVNGQKESMIRQGLFVPVGRVLAVLSPSSVPTLAELQRFGLQNVLGYSSSTPSADPNKIPQDLVYNPQKNYWARCGHDLDIKPGAVAAFRPTGSRRLWVIQPEGETHTLPAGSESLFAHDYVLDVPTAALPPFLNKKKQFKITNNTSLRLLRLSDRLPECGLSDFSAAGPAELLSEFPDSIRNGSTLTFEFRYNEADPTPMHVRFLVQPLDGVKHNYLLELTFSGPDLGTATSVFKRIADTGQGTVSIAEIPGTTVQHATNTPLLVPKPNSLFEGPWLKVLNATSFQLWKRSPEASDRFEREGRFFDSEIRINYDTPNFVLFAWGAGEVRVDIDFSLPAGIEMSSSRARQQKSIRLNLDHAGSLQVELLPGQDAMHFQCRISYVQKNDLNGVYLGDGMPTERGEAIYLPIAMPDNQLQAQVLRINPDSLSATASQKFAGRGVFAAPNDVVVTPEYVLATCGDNNEIVIMDSTLQYDTTLSNPPNYTVISAIKSDYDGLYCLLVMKDDKRTQAPIRYHYSLVRRFIRKDHSRRMISSETADISLDAVKGFSELHRVPQFPAWVSPSTSSPIALSPSIVSTRGERTREAAIGMFGGLFVVGSSESTIRQMSVESGGREEAIVYGHDGKEIFCAHSQAEKEGLRITRVDNVGWKQTHSLSLPRGEDVVDLTRDTRQRTPLDLYKTAHAASMVRTLDGKNLFVSHGRSIFMIDSSKLTLLETFKLELPCRLLHVWGGRPTNESHGIYGTPSSCILLYAIGSSYMGDGKRPKGDFVTRLYKLGIPD